MNFKTLQVGNDLREHILYSSHAIPLSICIDEFDNYFRREWPCHWHDEFEFVVVQKGTVEYSIYDEKARTANKVLRLGDGLFVSAGTLHSAKGLEPGAVLASFVFPITFFDRKIFENVQRQNLDPVVESDVSNILLKSDQENDRPLLSAMEELCAVTEQEANFELHCIELVCRVWRLLSIRISQEEKPELAASDQLQEKRLREVISFIHTHYSDRISVDDMARSARISRTECFRCFRTILGKTPTEYLTEYRLSTAAMLLANTSRTLTDISTSCGFNSPSYFGKLFRERCRVSPKKYRVQTSKQKN